jgi:hypothetical protein
MATVLHNLQARIATAKKSLKSVRYKVNNDLRSMTLIYSKVKESINDGLRIAYSPSGVSQIIAQSIIGASADKQREIMDNFVEMKQRELATVILSVCCPAQRPDLC